MHTVLGLPRMVNEAIPLKCQLEVLQGVYKRSANKPSLGRTPAIDPPGTFWSSPQRDLRPLPDTVLVQPLRIYPYRLSAAVGQFDADVDEVAVCGVTNRSD
jgi:hypothetical protein